MNEKQLYNRFVEWSKHQNISIEKLLPTVQKNEIQNIDLSIHNTIVKTEAEFNNPIFFQSELSKIQEQHPDKIIAGGYLEKRALYTSDIYNAENSSEKRNIHLGVDFWLPEQTPIHAILAGEVVCAVHQKDLKGYGGFVILEHHFKNLMFFSLYGHLSEESISKLSLGQKILQNEKIGVLGNYEENGKWVPHLHFQIMLSLLDYKNDFLGVALESKIDYWQCICPNPNLLFKSTALKTEQF